MLKKLTIPTLIFFCFLVITITVLYFPLYNYKQVILDGEKSLVTYTYNNQKTYWLTSFEQYILNERNEKVEFILTDNNPINPVITLIQKSKIAETSVDLRIYKLKRNWFNSFDFYKLQTATVKNKSFQEAVEIARKYDLTKENPDPANITVYPAPTKEEVEREKKNETIKSNPTRKAREDICNNLIAPLSELTNKAGGTTTPEITTKTKELNDCFAQLEKDFPTEPDPKFPNI